MSMGDTVHTQVLRDGERLVGIRRRLLRLVVKSGPDKGLRRQLSLDRMLVGTHPQCDLVLTDPTISRQHCEIVLVSDGYAIRDLESTNGMFVERLRVRDVTTDKPLTLRLGDTTLILTPLDETVDLPVASTTQLGPLIGQSVAMRRVFEMIEQLAPSETTVLLTGESGTGKELAAQAIHERSKRASGPFRVVDCGALAPSLIESELFGHVKGAFTGADQARDGAFVDGKGGTVFLDEIGELPIELQPRLLGALERRVVRPVGSSASVPVDVRIIAATHRDLRREVGRGAFREDLFFRLAVGVIEMPALRDRPDDIPLYIDAFSEGRARLSAAEIDRLRRQRWLGNVRELRNAVERALILGDDATRYEPEQTPKQTLSASIDAALPYKTMKGLVIDDFDRIYLEQLLKRHRDNITHAARAAEIDRTYLLRLLDRFGIRPTR